MSDNPASTINHVLDKTRSKKASRENHHSLTTLVFLFAAPLVLAYTAYFSGYLGGMTSRNKGTLIQPPLPIQALKIEKPSGEIWKFIDAQNQAWEKQPWIVFYLAAQSCDLSCEKSLYFMRQGHIALGKEAHRVQRLLIAIDGALAPRFETLLTDEYPRMMRAQAHQTKLKKALESLPALPKDTLFVADPYGNIILYYQPHKQNGKWILKDMKHLLGISQIG